MFNTGNQSDFSTFIGTQAFIRLSKTNAKPVPVIHFYVGHVLNVFAVLFHSIKKTKYADFSIHSQSRFKRKLGCYASTNKQWSNCIHDHIAVLAYSRHKV